MSGEILEGDSKNVAVNASTTNQQYHSLQTPYSSFPPYQWDPSGQQYPPYQHFPLPQDLYYQMGGTFQQAIIKEEPSQETGVLKGSSSQTIAKDEPSEEANATKGLSEKVTIKEEPTKTPDMLDPYQQSKQTHLKYDPSQGIPNVYYNFQFPHLYPPVNYANSFGSDLVKPDSAQVTNSNNSSQDTSNTSSLNLSIDPNNTSEINSSSDSNSYMNSSRNSSSGYDSAGDLDRSGTNQMDRSVNHQNGNDTSSNDGRNNSVNSDDELGLEKGDWKEDISSVPPGWKIQKIFSSGNHVKTMVMSPEGKIFPSRKDAFIYMETHLRQRRKSIEMPKRKDEQKKSIDNNLQPLTKKIKTNPPNESFEKLEYSVASVSDLERRNKNSGLEPEMLSKMKSRGQQPAVIWDYFINLKSEGSTNARCLYCNVSVIRPLATTSNMIGHLRTYHKDLYPTYEMHQKEARGKTIFNSSPEQPQENMTEKNLPIIETNSDTDKKSLPFKIPSSIEISLVKENTKVETRETQIVEQAALKTDPIDIMENDPYGPKISMKLTSFEKVCSVFLTNPDPPPSVIFGISDNNKMSMEDVKWIFIKLRKIFQYKGKPVDEVALRRLVSHVNFKHQHAIYFQF